MNFLPPYPKFPLQPFPHILQMSTFFNYCLKNMGSNQLFIIVFADDSYIYMISYKVFSELLLSP